MSYFLAVDLVSVTWSQGESAGPVAMTTGGLTASVQCIENDRWTAGSGGHSVSRRPRDV